MRLLSVTTTRQSTTGEFMVRSEIYRIEKSRIPVIVTLASGRRLAGEMFVQGSAASRYGPELPSDILNDGTEFFPLAVAPSETLLVSKYGTREVETTTRADADAQRSTIGREEWIEVLFADGSSCTGAVHLEVPGDRGRLLDFLNTHREQFLTVLAGDTARFINRRFIESVRPLD